MQTTALSNIHIIIVIIIIISVNNWMLQMFHLRFELPELPQLAAEQPLRQVEVT